LRRKTRACGTRGGTGPRGRRPRPQGDVAAPDPCPSGDRRSGGPRLWDTWRHRTRGSAAAPTGARGGFGPLPERGAEVPRLAPGWLDDSDLLEVRLPLVEAQVRLAEVRDLSAGVRTRGLWLPLLSAFVLVLYERAPLSDCTDRGPRAHLRVWYDPAGGAKSMSWLTPAWTDRAGVLRGGIRPFQRLQRQ